jgi:hypothetical protein
MLSLECPKKVRDMQAEEWFDKVLLSLPKGSPRWFDTACGVLTIGGICPVRPE